MSKDWDYAELSKNAREAGSPGEYISSIKEEGFNLGVLVGVAATVLVTGGGFVLNKIRKVYKQNKTKKLEETVAYDKMVMDQLYMDLTTEKVEEEDKIEKEGDEDE